MTRIFSSTALLSALLAVVTAGPSLAQSGEVVAAYRGEVIPNAVMGPADLALTQSDRDALRKGFGGATVGIVAMDGQADEVAPWQSRSPLGLVVADLEALGMEADVCRPATQADVGACLTSFGAQNASGVISLGTGADLGALGPSILTSATVVGVDEPRLGPRQAGVVIDTAGAWRRAVPLAIGAANRASGRIGVLTRPGDPKDPAARRLMKAIKSRKGKAVLIVPTGPISSSGDLLALVAGQPSITVFMGPGLDLGGLDEPGVEQLPTDVVLIPASCGSGVRALVGTTPLPACVRAADETMSHAAVAALAAVLAGQDVGAVVKVPAQLYVGERAVSLARVALAMVATEEDLLRAPIDVSAIPVGLRIGIVTTTTDADGQAVAPDLQLALEQVGLDAVLCDAVAGVGPCVKDLLSQGVASIVLLGPSKGLGTSVEDALTAGVGVVAVDRTDVRTPGAVVVATDRRTAPALASRMAADYHQAAWPGDRVSYLVIGGPKKGDTETASIGRNLGLSGPFLEPAGVIRSSPRSLARALTNAFAKHADVRVLLGSRAGASVKALNKVRGWSAGLAVFPTDCSPELVALVVSGSILKGCVASSTDGHPELVARVVALLVAGATLPSIVDVTPTTVVARGAP